MVESQKSVWMAVLLGIIGLTIGYVAFIETHTDIARAAIECPYKKNCTVENCDPGCPHCTTERTS